MSLTVSEEKMMLLLLDQQERERVSPKIEQARDFDGMIVGARGGRGAGAKSMGMTSLLVQESHREPHRVACLREIQNSLEESVYETVQETVDRLRYPGWKFTREYAESPSGAHWIFRGLKDMRSEGNIKGLQGFTRFFVDEAAYISRSSIEIIMPTLFRNPGAQFWFCYNPMQELDPITELIWNPYQDDESALLIDCEPGKIDNPWFSDELQKLSDDMKELDPDMWEHIYGGQPRKQGQYSVLSRSAIRSAMDRKIEPEGKIQIGVDVARFGDDRTEIYMRHGMKVTQHREFVGQDTMRTAKEAWSMVNHDPSILIVVDETGIGSGVVDKLRELGAKVVGVNFGGRPSQPQKYTTVADELWFEFPVDEADIPDDKELMQELAGRQYNYDREVRRKIESKAEYKKRIGKSPDKADALLLAYFRGGSVPLEKRHREAMKMRRQQ